MFEETNNNVEIIWLAAACLPSSRFWLKLDI